LQVTKKTDKSEKKGPPQEKLQVRKKSDLPLEKWEIISDNPTTKHWKDTSRRESQTELSNTLPSKIIQRKKSETQPSPIPRQTESGDKISHQKGLQ